MDNPGEAKYGMTRPQLSQAFARLRELGAKHFGSVNHELLLKPRVPRESGL